MLRKLAFVSIVALIPGAAFAADTAAPVTTAAPAATVTADAKAKVAPVKHHKVMHKTKAHAKTPAKTDAQKS